MYMVRVMILCTTNTFNKGIQIFSLYYGAYNNQEVSSLVI